MTKLVLGFPALGARQPIIVLAMVAGIGCYARLPNDLQSLMEMMNSNDQTTSVDSSNKVSRDYGAKGLLVVLAQGKPNARAMAALRLRHFPGEDVERALLDTAGKESDEFLRAQALCSLASVGTESSLDVAERSTHDPDGYVVYCAEEAVNAIKERLSGSPSKPPSTR